MGARPRFAVMSLTEAAAERVREIVGDSERPLLGLRIGIKKGGCAGMEYTILPVEAPDAKDEKIEGHGATVFVDPSAVLFLLGTVMDFETTKLRSGFVFKNPNEVSACGCGESVMLKPADLAGASPAA
ncbi:Fe-S cluster assembly scaffold SufA [Kaistia algarum]|uniref:Fe-S cluster assembly scaffold SufA n=1 Tax=Kaistia algarum TaxID=2083279 RepID=UPI000CE75427|nr:Fe-S cluster assembly scaffold SufA [Kaistia algarum]MCX5515213.1 Fe-S cluster assembly scaffold SufA [Kaistia algarum]PPE79928.1 Fe-S cluster assembly scaffold SufA [Kaistia algarum]